MATVFRTNRGFRREDLIRRIRALENQLAFVAGTASARGERAAVDAGQGVSTALATLASQFRNGANWMGDDAIRYGDDARTVGRHMLHQLSREVENRPVPALAVAVGVGFVIAHLFGRRN
jgi:ElaB/YqjD/DUF883 family membrane-anchored ribosome-binding protein